MTEVPLNELCDHGIAPPLGGARAHARAGEGHASTLSFKGHLTLMYCFGKAAQCVMSSRNSSLLFVLSATPTFEVSSKNHVTVHVNRDHSGGAHS